MTYLGLIILLQISTPCSKCQHIPLYDVLHADIVSGLMAERKRLSAEKDQLALSALIALRALKRCQGEPVAPEIENTIRFLERTNGRYD